MLQFLFFPATLAVFVYGFTMTVRTDYKRVLLHRLMVNHIKMKALYAKLEELIFLKDYYHIRGNKMSYDLYLTGLKKQNAIFEKEMEELRKSKFDSDVEKYYLHLIHSHENDLMALQSEINRAEHKHFLPQHTQNQQSA